MYDIDQISCCAISGGQVQSETQGSSNDSNVSDWTTGDIVGASAFFIFASLPYLALGGAIHAHPRLMKSIMHHLIFGPSNVA